MLCGGRECIGPVPRSAVRRSLSAACGLGRRSSGSRQCSDSWGTPSGPARPFEFGFLKVVSALGQILDQPVLKVGEGTVVGAVVGLDDLKGPVTGDDVTPEDLSLDRVGLLGVTRLAQ